ncbi:MAG: hypothetical protein ACOC25_08465 [Alkalispirochaetaceae bacterium]
MTLRATVLIAFMTLSTAGLLAQEPPEGVPSGVDGWVVLANIQTQEWRIVDHGGEGVSAPGSARVGLRVGGTYYFDTSNVESEDLPLLFLSGSGEVLLSQSRDGGEGEAADGVNAEIDEDGIQFELTEELAERLSRFRAAPYPSMVGYITVTGGTEEENGEQQEGNE